MSDNPNQGAPVRIGRWSILPDGTRKPLSPLVDDAHADSYGSGDNAFGIPVPDCNDPGSYLHIPDCNDRDFYASTPDPDSTYDGDDWRGDRERDNAENDPHTHRPAS